MDAPPCVASHAPFTVHVEVTAGATPEALHAIDLSIRRTNTRVWTARLETRDTIEPGQVLTFALDVDAPALDAPDEVLTLVVHADVPGAIVPAAERPIVVC